MKLSVVIATYEMQREAPRTLMSVLPPCQRETQNIDYEIIVIDNGSSEPLDFSSIDFAGRPVKVVYINPSDAKPSPVFAINDAVNSHATGDFLLICIDGARIFSSYLIRRTVDILTQFPHAFTFVGSRHLGHETQMIASQRGYDQHAEDELLDSVDWITDLDLLWEISVWAGAHNRENYLIQNESNAIGLSRDLWNLLGGYNPGFQRPGGGLCNLELFNRAVSDERMLNVLLYGETTFHQYHGGAATSSTSYFNDSLAEHKMITAQDYRSPRFNFLADLGTDYKRMQKLGHFLTQ